MLMQIELNITIHNSDITIVIYYHDISHYQYYCSALIRGCLGPVMEKFSFSKLFKHTLCKQAVVLGIL